MAEEKLEELFTTPEKPLRCFMCNFIIRIFYFANGICSAKGLAFDIGRGNLQAA